MYSLYSDYVFVFKYIGMSLQSYFLLLISEQLGILYGIFAKNFQGSANYIAIQYLRQCDKQPLK